MLAYLLAEIRTSQEEMKASHEESIANVKAGHEELMAIMETNQEKMMAKLVAHHERMMARMDSQLEKMDTTDLEANWEKSEATVEQQDAPKEEFVVETIGALVDQYGDRRLAVVRHQLLEKWTHGDGGSWSN
jgi:hypothetical protein